MTLSTVLLQVAEELNAKHCQAALAAMQESVSEGALTEEALELAVKLAQHLSRFRAEQPNSSFLSVRALLPFQHGSYHLCAPAETGQPNSVTHVAVVRQPIFAPVVAAAR